MARATPGCPAGGEPGKRRSASNRGYFQRTAAPKARAVPAVAPAGRPSACPNRPGGKSWPADHSSVLSRPLGRPSPAVHFVQPGEQAVGDLARREIFRNARSRHQFHRALADHHGRKGKCREKSGQRKSPAAIPKN